MPKEKRGGKRLGSGRPTDIPVGSGKRSKVTLTLSKELLDPILAAHPGLKATDAVRAVLWEARK